MREALNDTKNIQAVSHMGGFFVQIRPNIVHVYTFVLRS